MAHMLVDLCESRENSLTLFSSIADDSVQKRVLSETFSRLCSQDIKTNRIDKLPGTAVGISANFTRLSGCTDSSNTDRNTADSNVLCAWIDDDGGPRCTCVGHSRFQHLRSMISSYTALIRMLFAVLFSMFSVSHRKVQTLSGKCLYNLFRSLTLTPGICILTIPKML